ncbi:helix-turn-helix domain-containing protein [Mesobacillus harenae]|uniref:helix-turn-helix domain-containing protein n=1 Tax=Mesobacillus harenae TaxID=2213203 RepID=UPI001580D47B|nr:helix-turn-helix domain-containing protein [Mesobacillus harenae]
MRKVFNKSRLQENGEKFIPLPSNLRHYVYMNNYKAEMSFLYGLIVDYYNVEKGYAFPSIYQLAKDYGKSEKTVGEHLKVLKKVGLIDVFESSRGKVNFYKPLVPLTQEEFFAKYPIAAENFEKRENATRKKVNDDLFRLWAAEAKSK